jgi:hypothetical protein
MWRLHLPKLPPPRQIWDTSRATFVSLLDSEKVELFVWPYYIALMWWGFYGIFLGAPLTYVVDVMGPRFYDMWLWMHIQGTAEVMIGLTIKDKYLGLWWQLGGNFSMGLVLLAYEIAAYIAWGEAAYSFFAIAPYVVGCIFLSLIVVRKLYLSIHKPARDDWLARLLPGEEI